MESLDLHPFVSGGSINKYKEMLSLGYTVSLPELYRTAGIDFAFDDAVIA
jgi:oligoendopeptidase F